VIAAFLSPLFHTGLAAASIVVPGAQTTAEGNLSNSFPFGIGNQTIRYQQVYDAAQFPLEMPFYITEIRFRPDRINGNPFFKYLVKYSDQSFDDGKASESARANRE
jgi:hypothetical protein